MKLFKRILTVFFIILLSGVICILGNIYYSKNISYPKWVQSYLQSRYTENMIVQKINFSDMGYSAVVSPANNTDLEFSVRGKYIDTYLERILEYQAEQTMKAIYPEYNYTAQMFSYESITPPFTELYQLYKEYGRPANWDEVPDYIRLERLHISTNQDINDVPINSIIKTMLELEIKTSLIEIFDGNDLYSFRYDVSDDVFTSD